MTPFVVALPPQVIVACGRSGRHPLNPEPFRRASLTAGRALKARLAGVQQMRNSPPADCLAYLLSSSTVYLSLPGGRPPARESAWRTQTTAAKRKARRIRKQALRVGRLMRERGARPS